MNKLPAETAIAKSVINYGSNSAEAWTAHTVRSEDSTSRTSLDSRVSKESRFNFLQRQHIFILPKVSILVLM